LLEKKKFVDGQKGKQKEEGLKGEVDFIIAILEYNRKVYYVFIRMLNINTI